jgi:hypothetical protein
MPKRKQKSAKHAVLENGEDDLAPRHIRHRNVVGKIINFRGLIYAPVNENGVIFLFGKVAADLNMYVETIRPGCPDCIAKRYIGKGKWEELRIEFEFRSSDFERHKHHIHSAGECDAIVCWRHDWPKCPQDIEVIELQERIPRLENRVMEEPDKVSELSEHNVNDLFDDRSVLALYDALHPQVMKIDGEIWRKVGERTITYYSPDRVFTYLRVQKQGLRFTVFTNGKKLSAVEPMDYERGGEKWGRLHVKSHADLKHAIKALKASHGRLVEAIKRGENTGWWAEQD